MSDLDIAEGHELCERCRHPFELGECYSAAVVGSLCGVAITEPRCMHCTEEAA